MIWISDEVAARRETAREMNGQFGESLGSTPEVDLALPPPSTLAVLQETTDATRARLTVTLVGHIDASMPKAADFVNYRYHPENDHLEIFEACDDYGEWLDLAPFGHINTALRDLGRPYIDFDGDILINSLEDFGWERDVPHSPAREREAAATLDIARSDWQRAVTEQQAAAVTELRATMAAETEALDFAFDSKELVLSAAAVIGAEGRYDLSTDVKAELDRIAAHIVQPDEAGLTRSELSGLYRLNRA